METHRHNWLPTLCTSLDDVLGGGIPKGQVTLIYGAAKTGKTTLALQCTVAATRRQIKTIYLDCQHSFSLERLAQIASSDLQSISSLIYVFKLRSFHEQTYLIENLDRYLSDNTGLIIVDTITALYRLELGTPERIFMSNRILNRQLAYLNHIANTSKVGILVTSQVHDLFQEGPALVEPVAMRVLKYWSQNILKMTLGATTNTRRVVLEKSLGPASPSVTGECQIQLSDGGIRRVS